MKQNWLLINQCVGNLMFVVAKCQSRVPWILWGQFLPRCWSLRCLPTGSKERQWFCVWKPCWVVKWTRPSMLSEQSRVEPWGSGSEHLPAPKELTYILPLRHDYNCKSENINYTFIFLWFSFFCFSFHSRINFPVKGTFLMCQIHHCNEQVDKCGRWAPIRGCAAACSRKKPWLSQG